MKEKKILETDITTEEKKIDIKLRPQNINDYVGQEKIKNKLSVYIKAAKKRKEQLDHILLYGPPGLGKTTLAFIIAHELGVDIKVTSGPAIEKPAELAQILSSLSEGDVLFIDEIHRLSKQIEEVLYPAMEDYCIDIMIGSEDNTKSIRLDLPKFTLIGATTRVGLISSPLHDRFGIIEKLEYYSDKELTQIVNRSSKVLNANIVNDAAVEIAKRSRGTPRIANRFLKRIRDFADVKHDGNITKDICMEALAFLDVDALGLDSNDRNYLYTLCEKFKGGPVGVEALAIAIGEDKGTIEDIVEPFLLTKGVIERTMRGRVATEKAYEITGSLYKRTLFDNIKKEDDE